MSSWRIQFKANTGQVSDIELIDKVGPFNEWHSLNKNAFIPDKGTFTNQSRIVAPTVQPSWLLNNIDIDEVKVGAEGTGEVRDNEGSFPIGDITWKVISEI